MDKITNEVLVQKYLKDDEYVAHPQRVAVNRFIQDMFEKLGGKIVKKKLFGHKIVFPPDKVFTREEFPVQNSFLLDYLFNGKSHYEVAYEYHNIALQTTVLYAINDKKKVRVHFEQWSDDYSPI